MSKKTLGLIITGVALTVVTVLCILTLIGTINSGFGQFRVVSNDTVKATAYETIELEPEDITGLEFDMSFSNFEVYGTESNQITIDLIKTGWAATEEEATADAENLELKLTRRGKTAVFTARPENNFGVSVGVVRSDSIDVVLTIPKGMALQLNTNNGEISITGTQGNLEVFNNFGSTTIEEHSGSLTVDSRNGDISLRNLDLAGEFSVGLNFGNLIGREINAGDIIVDIRNGDITLEDITATDDCTISTNFADIEVNSIDCMSLTTDARNGKFDFKGGEISGPFKLTTDFGNLRIKDLYANGFEFNTRNGDVYANSLQGPVNIEHDFGDIELYGISDVTLSVTHRNGSFFYSGTLDSDSEHSISSDFGNIELRIPNDSAFDVLVSTEFGEIETDFQITMSGNIDVSSFEGQINGGGPLLEIENRNGDISLFTIEDK